MQCVSSVSIASSRYDRVDPGYRTSSGADLGKKGLRQPGREIRAVAVAASGAGEGAEDETNNFEIRKTNLECVLESTFSLFGVSLQDRRLGARVAWSLPDVKPNEGGANNSRC